MKSVPFKGLKPAKQSICRRESQLTRALKWAFVIAGMAQTLACSGMQNGQGYPGQSITIIPGILSVQVQESRANRMRYPNISTSVGGSGSPNRSGASTYYSTTGQPLFLPPGGGN